MRSTAPARCAAPSRPSLEDKLAEAILEGAVKKDEEVLVTRENDTLKFSSPVAANL